MNVRQIVEEYLKANDYDGLFNENGECGCDLEDFMTCGFQDTFCVAAHKEKPAPDSEWADEEWVMVAGKKGEAVDNG